METVVLQNSAILDCTGRDPYPRGTLIVADKRIQAVGPMDQVPVPREGRVIDLEGRTIMPGLIDAHAHVALMGGHMGDISFRGSQEHRGLSDARLHHHPRCWGL